jgi:hypothetical protein
MKPRALYASYYAMQQKNAVILLVIDYTDYFFHLSMAVNIIVTGMIYFKKLFWPVIGVIKSQTGFYRYNSVTLPMNNVKL